MAILFSDSYTTCIYKQNHRSTDLIRSLLQDINKNKSASCFSNSSVVVFLSRPGYRRFIVATSTATDLWRNRTSSSASSVIKTSQAMNSWNQGSNTFFTLKHSDCQPAKKVYTRRKGKFLPVEGQRSQIT